MRSPMRDRVGGAAVQVDASRWAARVRARPGEVPRGARGLNQDHIELLLARLDNGDWTPDLTRLECLPPDANMNLEEYAEAWAWIHFLLESHPAHRALVCAYLQDLREFGWAEPISVRLGRRLATPQQELAQHILMLGGLLRR